MKSGVKSNVGGRSRKSKPEGNHDNSASGNPKSIQSGAMHPDQPGSQPGNIYGVGGVRVPRGSGSLKGGKIHERSILEHANSRPESQLTSLEKMEATRKGISKRELEQLKKRAGLDYDQLSHILQVARATLISRKGVEKFPSLLSEKIMSLADIYSYGYEVFGDEEAFNKWIFQPIAALGGKLPYEILDNQYGREEVKHVIGRIEYGVYS